jgi:hypothetical protein
MDEVRERILLVFSTFATNINKLSDGDTALRNRLTRQINNDSAITIDSISVILNAFPEVSAEWLIRGKGEMLLSENLPKFHGEETDTELDVHAELTRKTAELEELKLQVLRLDAQKDYLQERNDDLVVSCRMLQDELNKYQEPKNKKGII